MDNVRVDDLSLYGYARETTPNLARLARRAVKFKQARDNGPVDASLAREHAHRTLAS